MMNFPTPCIFAHRGASSAAPENTLAAFNLALQQGAHAIELDAKLSKDGEIVVIHDQKLDRTTNGSGFVHQMLYSEMRTLDAGNWFGPDFTNEKVPLLSDVLEAVGRRMIVNVEVTNYRTSWDDLPEKIAELVKRMKLQDSVLFSSFLPKNLRKLKQLIPGTQVALLTEPHVYPIARFTGIAKATSPAILHPYLFDLSAKRIQQAHQKKIRLHTWTVNKEEDMRRLLGWGIDGLFTDYPELAMSLIGQTKPA